MKFVEKNRTVEPHAESILYLYLQGANGVPVSNKKIKIYAGPPPTGEPPYFVDDDPNNPNRRTDAGGKFQFVVENGAPRNTLDFYVQVLGSDGSADSEPIHVPFPEGRAQWAIITAADESAEPSDGGDKPDVPVTPDLDIDPRLERELNVGVDKVTPAPGVAYWKLISAKYQDPDESGGNVNIVCFVQDERGNPLPGTRVTLRTTGGDTATQITDERGHCDHPMTGDSSFAPDRDERGPLTVFVEGLMSDDVSGMGLPLRRHVHILTWRRAIVPDLTPIAQALPTAPPPMTPEEFPEPMPVVIPMAPAVLAVAADPEPEAASEPTPESTPELTPEPAAAPTPAATSQPTPMAVPVAAPISVPPPQPQPALTGTVRGRVSNAPAGARLVLRSPSRTLDALVALDGLYSFTSVPVGVYTLELAGVGVINPTLNVSPNQTTAFDYPSAPQAPIRKVLKHYLLFGPGTQPGTLTNLILALDYIVHFTPVVGFSVEEAMSAERVTIVGGTSAVSSQDELRLRDGGSQVARLQAPDSYALENLFQQLLASGSPYPDMKI